MLSHFQTAGFTILCSEERWEIQCQDPARLGRMVELAGRTFDILEHTPVRAFGLNFHFVRPTGLPDVGKRLGKLVNSLPLGRRAAEDDSAVVITSTAMPDRVIQETVTVAPGAADCAYIGYNVEHPIKAAGGLFELTPLLSTAWREDYPECHSRADQIAEALAGSKER
jgi:hypothetical protein